MPTMAMVFLSWNGKTAASRLSFEFIGLNGVILLKRPVINGRENREHAAVDPPRVRGKRVIWMLRFLKLLFVLAVMIAVAVVGYAYLGDLRPEQQDVSEPVELDTN